MYLPAAAGGRGPSGDPRGLHHRGTGLLPPPLHSMKLAFSTEPVSVPGEDGLRKLCQSLLRGHRGGDERDLHIQPHLEAL